MNWRFVLSMARREGRASRRRFLLYGSCMALGIAALVGLHGLRATVRHAVDGQSQRLLGADLRLGSRAPLGKEIDALVAGLASGSAGGATAGMTRFGSMALAERSGRTRLVDVQAVDAAYPLHGAIRSEPAASWARLQSDALVALVDPSLLVQLDARVGDSLGLGEARFEITGTVTRAPGTFGMRTQIAPRVFIARRHVEATGLVQRGSMVEYLRFVRAGDAAIGAWLEANRPALDSAHVRVQTIASYQEELARTFGVLTRYLGLVGLAALALGGVGVAAGIRVFVREKLDTVALLRSLGASGRDALAVYGLLALALGAAAGVIGSAFGVVLQWALPGLLQSFLPVEVPARFEPSAIATGLVLGLWVTALFAAGPLYDLARTPPLRALRRDFSAEEQPRTGRIALLLALGASLVAGAVWQAPRPLVGLGFAGGLAGALLLLAAAAVAVAAFLRRHRLRRAPWWLRQGVANLFRPRNHTVATTVTIGFGLFLVATLHGVQHNVLRQIALDARPDRPNLILFDVQRDQVAELEAMLAERSAPILDRAPLISARVTGVSGRSNADLLAAEDTNRELRWALQREYRLTYSDLLRESETVVVGSWWEGGAGGQGAAAGQATPEGPVPVSLETSIAETLGVLPGDGVTWEIHGVPIESTVQSVRRVDWGRMATNFFAVFPSGVLETAPQSTVFLTRIEDAGERAELQRDLVAAFPNISALDASVILRTLDVLLGQVWMAVRVLSLFALATGLLVLVAATATARSERTREGLLLRTLGASGRTVRRIVATEAVALGLLAASLGTGLSLLSSWVLVRFVFELPFDPPLRDLAALALGTLAVSALLGATGGRRAAGRSPLAALREAELAG